MGNYVDQGFLAPLDDRFKRDFKARGKTYEGVNAPDKIWELVVRGQDIYAVPMGFYGMTLSYRKDLFLKAGLDPSRPPTTWGEMWEMGKRLTYLPANEPDALPGAQSVYGMYLLNGQAHGGFYFLQFVWASGGQVVQSYRRAAAGGKLTPVPPPHFPYQDYGIELWNAKQYAAAKAPEPRGLEGPVVWRLVTDSPRGGGGAGVLPQARHPEVAALLRRRRQGRQLLRHHPRDGALRRGGLPGDRQALRP